MGNLGRPWILVGVLSAVGCGTSNHSNLLAGSGTDAAAGGTVGAGGQSSSGGSNAGGSSAGGSSAGGSSSGGSSGSGGSNATGGTDGGTTNVPDGGPLDAGTGGVSNGGTGGVTSTGGTGGASSGTGGASSGTGGASGDSGDPATSSGFDCKAFCQRVDDLAAACGHGSGPGGNCEAVCNATKGTCAIAQACFACTGASPTVSCGDAGHPVLAGCEQKCDDLEGRCGLTLPGDAGHGGAHDSGAGGGGGGSGPDCGSICTAIVAAGCAMGPTFDACKSFCVTAHETCPTADSCFQCGGPNPAVECSDTGHPVVPNCADCTDLPSQCVDASP